MKYKIFLNRSVFLAFFSAKIVFEILPLTNAAFHVCKDVEARVELKLEFGSLPEFRSSESPAECKNRLGWC